MLKDNNINGALVLVLEQTETKGAMCVVAVNEIRQMIIVKALAMHIFKSTQPKNELGMIVRTGAQTILTACDLIFKLAEEQERKDGEENSFA